ncbi:serine/threonine protein phosphatase PrpC [Sphingobium sp. OAS761]|uniref:bifunctional protein-serine/threonine kinase/phosphatase n=1 Tax=Sphingobium sp. OAS761 TaxID=2817901 RepID=UPI00209DE787|nr:bifunctional protein-serine/threonine kinase/phosphatase [Sphingobium sp. OAS761]MCP1471612.1 serine/threonine protein phosphatase PrpC [Sphingobium sp. OAS761]
MSRRLTIETGAFSAAGAKAENQDFHGILIPEDALLASKGIAMAVADGISTSALGAVAAETAVKSFLSDYYATSEAWSVQSSARRVIAATNSWMHAQNVMARGIPATDAEREQGMICTLSAMVIKSRAAHLFQIGDSRVARLADGTVEALTPLHRVDLGGGETYLGRAMGADRHVEIDHVRVALKEGDVLLLTTDGVHDVLTDARIALLLPDGAGLNEAARAICEAAVAAGAMDNVTCQIVRILSLPEARLDDVVADGAILPPAPPLQPGALFEGYRILRELHAGSRSHVYLAEDAVDGTKVVLKRLSTEHAADPARVQALLLEEWIARRTLNPHLLGAPAGRHARRHAYAVSHHVAGQTLDSWLNDHPRPDLLMVRSIVAQVAKGLQALHRREILHRDLRPANILVDADGTARIIDFGSAQVAGLEDICPPELDAAHAGTMQFSAPELYRGEAASRRSDLFSLGVVTYYLLTGALPYGPRLAQATAPSALRGMRYISARSFNADVPPWMDSAIARAVALDPDARYDELSEFTFDLSHPNPALPAVTAPRERPHRPERLWQAISLLLFLALLMLLWGRVQIYLPE